MWIAPILVALFSVLYDVFYTNTNMYQYITASTVALHLVGVCVALALSISFLGLYGLSLEWTIEDQKRGQNIAETQHARSA